MAAYRSKARRPKRGARVLGHGRREESAHHVRLYRRHLESIACLAVAELVFTAANEIFKHGVARHTVIANPCAGISVSAICGKRQPRTRMKLTEEELKVILPALSFIGHQNALATKILLATCTRINELAGAKWEHVDLDRAEVLPHSKGKDRAFTIPLCPAVVVWFQGTRGSLVRNADDCILLPRVLL